MGTFASPKDMKTQAMNPTGHVNLSCAPYPYLEVRQEEKESHQATHRNEDQ